MRFANTFLRVFSVVVILQSLFLSNIVFAQQAAAADSSRLAYFGIEPDIVTNYVSKDDSRLGYLRLTIELMINDYQDLPVIEHHEPLVRAKIIEIVGKQTESQIKSLIGREDIRRDIVSSIKQIMQKETGKTIVKDIFFTKYLYEN